MLTLVRGAVLAHVAAIAVVLPAGTAMAQIEVSTTAFRATSSSITFGSEEVSIICAVTLIVTLGERRISLTSGSLFGRVSSAIVNEAGCTGGRVRLLSSGWPVLSLGLPQGVLRLRIQGMSGLVDTSGGAVRCLYADDVELTNAEDAIRAMRVDESLAMSLSRRLGGSLFCPEEATMRGQFTISPELAYTVTEAEALPLRPTRPTLSYRAMFLTLEMAFTNSNWIVDLNVDNRSIQELIRFRLVEGEENECFAMRTIADGDFCIDAISLYRAREAGEENGRYVLTLRGLPVGRLTLTD